MVYGEMRMYDENEKSKMNICHTQTITKVNSMAIKQTKMKTNKKNNPETNQNTHTTHTYV